MALGVSCNNKHDMVDKAKPEVIFVVPRISPNPKLKAAASIRLRNQDPTSSRRPDTLLRAIKIAQQETGIGTNSGPARLVNIHSIDGQAAKTPAITRHRSDFAIIGLQDIFHPQALMDFFRTVNACIQIDQGKTIDSNLYEAKLDETRIQEIHREISLIWSKRGHISAKELLQELTKQVKGLDPKIFASSLAPHPLTGLTSKFSAPVEIALAHAHALSTQEPMSIIFGDVGNVGGTNHFFRRLLFSDLMLNHQFTRELWNKIGITEEEITEVEEKISAQKWSGNHISKQDLQNITKNIREKAANKLTDWITRAMMHEVKQAFKEELPEIYEQIKFHGLGGDEIVILAPASSDRVKTAIHTANQRVQKLIKELGLNHHKHLKSKAPGMGLTLLVRDLNDPELKLETVTEKSEFDLIKPPTDASFEQPDLPHSDSSRLNIILDQLSTEPYQGLNPTKEQAQYSMRGKFDPSKCNDPNYLISYQLYNVFNRASGATDISALAESFNPDKHKAILGINLMNLAAINDKLNLDLADKYQRELSKALSAIPQLAKAEIFSAGPGKFYLLLENNISFDTVYHSISEIVANFNNREEVKGEKLHHIRDLANPEDANFKGLHFTMVNPGISPGTSIHIAYNDASSMLKRESEKYVSAILRNSAG